MRKRIRELTVKYWFFDLDGTLADTDRDIRDAWKDALSDLGLSCPDFESRFVAGPPIDDMAKALFPDIFTQQLADSIRTAFARRYDSCGFPRTREYLGALDAVRRLKARGDYAAIVTNKRYVGAMTMARRFGWNDVFDGIYAGDMYVAQGVPGAAKLRKGALLARLIGELAAPKASCTIVGDTRSDFEAARECGIGSIGVAWGYGKPDELAMADAVVNDASEIGA